MSLDNYTQLVYIYNKTVYTRPYWYVLCSFLTLQYTNIK